MDSHEIPLARLQKVEDLFAVRFRFLRPLDFRHVGGVRSQHFAHRQARQLQHVRDLAFAHSLRTQFQNRGSLCLAQHVSAPAPFRFVPPSAPVPAARFQSGPALVSVAGLSSPAGLRPAACRHDAGWQAPYPDRAPLVRPPPPWLPLAAAAFSKTVPARQKHAREPRACLCARPCRVVRLAACRNDARRTRRPCARNRRHRLAGYPLGPAPDTSSLLAPRACPRALAAGSLPAATPPAPAASIPN